jgi:hypothetical protein
MGPWKNLKGIAGGILGSFLSRNNDLDGYWGMGILRLLAQEHGVEMVYLDLLAGTCMPPDRRGAGANFGPRAHESQLFERVSCARE